MLDFDDGVRDLVKRIDNVTIQLAGLFCCLENELLELYQLCGSGSERGSHGLKKSEFIEGMKKLLGNSCLDIHESMEDEYLIALDNSLMSLETLTSVLVGNKCYVNCKVVNESHEKDGLGDMSSAIQDCDELGLSEINENSSLIRLCRSISRLTKHRNNIERYDAEVNSELENIKEDKTRELESRLKEMEVKLRSKQALCYAHERQIEYLKCDLEELSRNNIQIVSQLGIQEMSSEGGLKLGPYSRMDSDRAPLDSPADRSDLYSENEQSDEQSLDECSKKESESKTAPLKIEPISNFNQAISNQSTLKYESASMQETFREEDLDILELKDQIQILNLDLQFLKDENCRLKLQLERATEAHSDIPEKAVAETSEVLYNILLDKSSSENYTETEIEVSKDRVVDKKIQQILNVSILNSLPKLKTTELQRIEIHHSNTQMTCQNPKPCLVMWEPIIDCPPTLSSAINTQSNIIPLPMSSYGQFRKSRKDGRRNPATIIEGANTTRRSIHVNRNSFYCDLEKIIKSNIRRRESLVK
ncbi:hypothetical protein OIY81_2572 [Cryptosporidium canis]|nr:hypothetical protein OIY81_2572 [Cryptosporidium canis]